MCLSDIAHTLTQKNTKRAFCERLMKICIVESRTGLFLELYGGLCLMQYWTTSVRYGCVGPDSIFKSLETL